MNCISTQSDVVCCLFLKDFKCLIINHMHHNSQRHHGQMVKTLRFVVWGPCDPRYKSSPNCYLMSCQTVKLQRMCEVYCVYLPCFKVVGTKELKKTSPSPLQFASKAWLMGGGLVVYLTSPCQEKMITYNKKTTWHSTYCQ